ncbi:hypothetical protein HK098_004223 [Nowakowskiella sp. JEL0407]|nr:hypothetical protein HK098_004223 [Nowakowskiella sp. JEL0407]
MSKFRIISNFSLHTQHAFYTTSARPKPQKFRRLTRFLLGVGVLSGGVWTYDYFYNYSTLERNFRTVFNAAIIGLDYYFNFKAENAEHIDDLHLRSAQRMLKTCLKNGGLYIKFGQQIASLNGISPPQYSDTFRVLFDDAPSVPYAEVSKIICKDFNVSDPSEIFSSISEQPIASASIAQVHTATLKDANKTKIAVKIQKPAIENQIYMDLFTFRNVLLVFEYFYDLPLSFSSKYVEKHMLMETDFVNEARNCKEAAVRLAQNPVVAERAYVPKVYEELTSKRVLTLEWIDGIRFQDLPQHEDEFPKVEIMETVVDVFADQIFRSGFVHCDPHAGNLLIRKNPQNPLKNQVVLLDHGLYIHCTEKFRHEYALLWKSVFTNDTENIRKVAKGWGINDTEMFSQSTMHQRFDVKTDTVKVDLNDKKEMFKIQQEASKRVKKFLADTDKIPRELIFIGRNLNIVRSNNKYLGSPVNRINMMANWAIKEIGPDWSAWANKTTIENEKLLTRQPTINLILDEVLFVIKSRFNYWTFRVGLLLSSIVFQVTETWKQLNGALFGKRVGGFEEFLDSQMKNEMEQKFGIVIDEAAFDG